MHGPYNAPHLNNSSRLKRAETTGLERETLLQRNDVVKHEAQLEKHQVWFEDDPRSLAEKRRQVTVRRVTEGHSYGVASGWGQ